MRNKLKGIIILSKKIKDNDLFIKILSSNDRINIGMVYGGNSSKKKLIYQNGYFIDFSSTKKNINSPQIFSADICKPFLGNIFNDKYKLNSLLSILDLINLSMIEGQYIKGFYKKVELLVYKIINEEHWIIFYCEWLFNLLQLIGYQIDYKNNYVKKYFNIIKLEFCDEFEINCVEFPHELFSLNKKINFKNINTIFLIFESIFMKNHLDSVNYNMSVNFINFRNLILSELKK